MADEADIQRAILIAFERVGVLAWRAQAGKVKVRGGWMQLGPDGLPDIIVVVPPNGRLLGLEVKAPKGKERPAQVAFSTRAKSLGAHVATVRTVAEALLAFEHAKGGAAA